MIYGYMRKSNEEGSNSSFDTQKHKIKGYCQIHNLNVDEYFEDNWIVKKQNNIKRRLVKSFANERNICDI